MISQNKGSAKSLIKNLFFSFQMSYDRAFKQLGKKNQDLKQRLKYLNQNLDVTFNGMIEFVKICCFSNNSKELQQESLVLTFELILDLFGEYR